MGIRDTINRNPKVGFVLTGAFLVLAAAALAYAFWPDSNREPTKAFFSDDDGKTVFVDSVRRVAPFDHNGRPAVEAAVFTADNGKTQFVGYLKRYTDDVKKRLDASAGKTGPEALTVSSPDIAANGFEVKKPGDSGWVSAKDLRRRGEIMRVKGQGNTDVDSVLP